MSNFDKIMTKGNSPERLEWYNDNKKMSEKLYSDIDILNENEADKRFKELLNHQMEQFKLGDNIFCHIDYFGIQNKLEKKFGKKVSGDLIIVSNLINEINK